MRCCKKALKLLLLLLPLWLCSAAFAEGISINKAEVRSNEQGYYLTANYHISLPFSVELALTRGVPLYFTSEFTVTRTRWYWLNKHVFRNEQLVKLSYNVLTRQYRVSRGNLYRNFSTLDEALQVLSIQSSATFPASLVADDRGYLTSLVTADHPFTASVRMILDIDQLPKLLQVNALTSDEWNLSSDRHQWELSLPTPEEDAEHD